MHHDCEFGRIKKFPKNDHLPCCFLDTCRPYFLGSETYARQAWPFYGRHPRAECIQRKLQGGIPGSGFSQKAESDPKCLFTKPPTEHRILLRGKKCRVSKASTRAYIFLTQWSVLHHFWEFSRVEERPDVCGFCELHQWLDKIAVSRMLGQV
jgi:hypothetical protein